jgi:hypothetical protein
MAGVNISHSSVRTPFGLESNTPLGESEMRTSFQTTSLQYELDEPLIWRLVETAKSKPAISKSLFAGVVSLGKTMAVDATQSSFIQPDKNKLSFGWR